MQKTIIIFGYGVGISDAVANRFGSEGFQIAMVARSADKLDQAKQALAAKGIQAAAFPADLTDPDSAKSVVQHVRQQLGPITAIHWNAYSNLAGDVTSTSAAALRTDFDVAVTSLMYAVQAALTDLKAAQGAVLVTQGLLALYDPKIDAMAVQWNSMGLAIANAAKHKLVGLLTEKLRAEEVTVGEVVVHGLVKGTAWDDGSATIDPRTIAAAFWDIYAKRQSKSVTVS
ncbi:MAG: SDR family NAD(P)-dependent oxidoreductase [Candidatus Solibacter sp.]